MMANGTTSGLDGVVAAETVLSGVDGEAGRLVIRGHALDEFAGWRFEEAVSLLWRGFVDLPPGPLDRSLGLARRRVFDGMAGLDRSWRSRAPIEAVRALLARLADGEDGAVALDLLAGMAVFTAAAARVAEGRAPVAPDPDLGHAADFLRMLDGTAPAPARVAALDAYLVTVIDHGFNASTFAARVTASTRAGLASAVLAGLSALKGPLHGGAPGPVIEMLDGVGKPDNARAWLEAALARGDRLMGFGHRVYHVRDPRADALKRAVRVLGRDGAAMPARLALAEAVEAAALRILAERKPGRSLDTNVELYTALLLEALGVPASVFTCVFAMSRAAGWIAHAREQVLTGRLIRPASRYVGPAPRVARRLETV